MSSKAINEAHGAQLAEYWRRSGVTLTCMAVFYDTIRPEVDRLGASRQAVNIAEKQIRNV